MAGAYDDRDGKIWMDGKLVEWRDAKVHILTHALHYASSVFEGERCYNGKIFKGHEHSLRLRRSAELLDMEVPYTAEELDIAKDAVLKANGWDNAYVRALAWRGSGEDMGVAAKRNPVRVAVAAWEWGNYYGDAKMKGAKLDIAKWRRPDPATIPSEAKAAGLYMICTMSKHAAEAKGCSDAMMFDYRGYVAEATGANIFFVKDVKVRRLAGGVGIGPARVNRENGTYGPGVAQQKRRIAQPAPAMQHQPGACVAHSPVPLGPGEQVRLQLPHRVGRVLNP